jgi:SET domain-containing protein
MSHRAVGPRAENKQLPVPVRRTAPVHLHDGTVIAAGISGNVVRWINHSCEQSCETRENDVWRVLTRAIRQILRSDESTDAYWLAIPGRLF